MQFTAREQLKVNRERNKLLGITFGPDELDFSIRLHNEELIPDGWAQCFRDFTLWLNKKTDLSAKPCWNTPPELHLESFQRPTEVANETETASRAIVWQLEAQRKRADCINETHSTTFAKLDTLALGAGHVNAETTYNAVRDQWFAECVQEAKPPDAPPDTHPGTTDSSIDFYHMNDIGDEELDPRHWHNHSDDIKAMLVTLNATAAADLSSLTSRNEFFADAFMAKTIERAAKRAEKEDELAPEPTPFYPWRGEAPAEEEDPADPPAEEEESPTQKKARIRKWARQRLAKMKAEQTSQMTDIMKSRASQEMASRAELWRSSTLEANMREEDES